MKLLVIGTSQVLCLRDAHRNFPALLGGAEVSFAIKPGAPGPYFKFNEDGTINDYLKREDVRPAAFDPETTYEQPVSEFDVVLVSALGWVDGGYRWDCGLNRLAQVSAFGPVGGLRDLQPVSLACYRQTLMDELDRQEGRLFLHRLRAAYPGPIIVQPAPRLSADVIAHPDWLLRRIYNDPAGMYRLLADCNDRSLEKHCQQIGAVLLPMPEFDASAEDGFTPAEYMSRTDGVHPYPNYGAKVLAQVAERISLMSFA